MALGLVGSFVTNTALSLTFTLIGSWLSPKKQQTIPEDIPPFGSNQPLYHCFGSTFCPTSLLYALPAAKAGHSEEFSTYACLGFVNPDNSSQNLAVRVNNITISSRSDLLPLNAPANTINRNTYTNGLGMATYFGVEFETQLNINQINSDFSALGYAGLQYSGLTWIRFKKLERKYLGGYNSRITWFVENKIVGNSQTVLNINNNQPVTVRTHVKSFGNDIPLEYTYPNGFYGARILRCYEGESYSVIGIGGGASVVLYEGIPEYNDIKFYSRYSTTGTTPIGAGEVGIYPQFAQGFGAENQGMVTNAIVGKQGGELKTITLPGSYQSPLKSNNGNLFDNGNGFIMSLLPGEKVYGWNATLFHNAPNDPTYWMSNSNLEAGSNVASGTLSKNYTSLSVILTDLLLASGFSLSNIQFINFTEVQINGFTTTLDNPAETIISLCTAYGKIIDDGFSGVVKFSDYPDGATIDKIYLAKDLLSEPSFEDAVEVQQPKEVNLTYRDIDNEFVEKSISVGYGNPYPNNLSQTINVVCSEREAKQIAWNILFLTGHTNLAARLHVSDISGLKSGSVIIFNKPGGTLDTAIKLLVTNIEIGADSSYLLNCVNFVPLYDYFTNNNYTEYMLGISSISTSPVTPSTTITPFLIPAEDRVGSSSIYPGTLFYTGETTNYSSYSDDGDLTPKVTINPTVLGFRGFLIGFIGGGKYGYTSLTVSNRVGNNSLLPASGIIRIGESWVSYTSYTTSGNTYTLLGIKAGLFASSHVLTINDIVTAINTNNRVLGHQLTANTINPAYVIQGSTRYDLQIRPPSSTFPTGLNIGDVTTKYPYGYPFSGIVVATVMTSYYAGVLKIWLSKPGSNNNFFLDTRTGGTTPFYTTWWVKDSANNTTYLGSITTAYVEILVTLAPGNYTLYQQKANGTNLPCGSFVFTN